MVGQVGGLSCIDLRLGDGDIQVVEGGLSIIYRRLGIDQGDFGVSLGNSHILQVGQGLLCGGQVSLGCHQGG